MTIIARFDSLTDAYEGMEALRSNAIPPGLRQNDGKLEISVDDDFAENAKTLLSSKTRCLIVPNDGASAMRWSDYDEQNL